MEISPNSGASSGPAWSAIAPVACSRMWELPSVSTSLHHGNEVFTERCGLLTISRLNSPRGVPAVQ